MNRLILLIASLIVMSMVLMTNQVSAKYFIGAGTNSCGAWLEARKIHGGRAMDMQAWVLGYVSGRNQADPRDKDFLVEPDAEALFAWLDSYCPRHPLDKFVSAINALIYDLSMRAAVAGTKPK